MIRPHAHIWGDRINGHTQTIGQASERRPYGYPELVTVRKAPDTGWMERAACKDSATKDFFVEAEDGQFSHVGIKERRERALAVCAECPVRQRCLDYAMVMDCRFGIWGGKTWQERRRM